MQVNGTETRLFDRLLGFGPANQIIHIAPHNGQIPQPVIHYYLART